MKKRILLILLLLFIVSLSFVSASENVTDLETIPTETDTSIDNDNVMVLEESDSNDSINEDDNDSPKIYVNSSKEVSGDGSSWENATKNILVENNAKVFLAEGEYGIPDSENKNITYIGLGDNTIINSFSISTYFYPIYNAHIDVVNVTFKTNPTYVSIINFNHINDDDIYINYPCNIKADTHDFNFINCNFINASFVSRLYNKLSPDRDGVSETCTLNFNNCTFNGFYGNYLITNWEYSKFVFNNCIFENINNDAIIDSYGGQMGQNGVADGVYIYNSEFRNCTVNGIVKAKNIGNCEIEKCRYDFDASNDVALVSPFYVNKTDISLNETKLNIDVKDNSIVITLLDITANKPIYNSEIGVFKEGKVFTYDVTDINGQIVLKDLLGTYNFEFSYPGDEYAYQPFSINKTFSFKIATSINVSPNSVDMTYNSASKNIILSTSGIPDGVKFTVKIGDKTLTGTVKNNKVSLTIPSSLKPATYRNIKITYDGDDTHAASSATISKVAVGKVAPMLTAKNAKFKAKTKTKKYTVTLKGKNVKGIKVTLKIKGKKAITATINSKGKATFKITKLTKKGTYKATITTKANSYNKAVTKKNVKFVIK